MDHDKSSETPEKDGRSQPESPDETGIGVALLLTAAAILAALIAGRAHAHSANAATAWQTSTRDKVKEAVSYVESIRYIYGVEVPRALAVTEVRLRADELAQLVNDRSLSASTRRSIAVEKAAQEAVLEGIASASTLASDPKYRTDNGFDAVRMLIDDRNANPELLAVDPEASHEEGDRLSEKAIALMATTVLVAVAFLCGSLARGFPRRRRLWLPTGFFFLAAGLVSAVVIEVA